MDRQILSVLKGHASQISRSVVGWTIMCCVVVLTSMPRNSHAAPAVGDRITLTYNFDAPRVAADGVVSKVSLTGLAAYGEPGKPVLPFKQARILLPFGTEVDRVQIKPGNRVNLPGVHTLAWGQRPAPLSRPDRLVQTAPDRVVYALNSAFPTRLDSGKSVQYKRGFAVLCLDLWPVEYVPAQGQVSYYQNLTVEVSLRPAAANRLSMLRPRGLREDKAEIGKLVDNADVVATYPDRAPNGQRILALDPARPYDYIVITDPAFVASFMPLVNAHSSTMLTTVVTTTWIYANYSGARPDGGTDNQTRIRNFILDAYHTWGTQYVLLGGDGDGASVGGESGNNIVPCRGFAVDTGYDVDNNIPADMYYGCLDGTFDQNHNGIYGEPNDGSDGGEVDLFFEVNVGRAAVDSVAETDNFVAKTLWYMGASGDWLKEVRMASEYLGFGGVSEFADLMKDQIKNGTTVPVSTIGFLNSANASFFRVHDLADNRAPYSYPPGWPVGDLVTIINNGVHAINHDGHGNNTWVMKMNNAAADSLTNSLYFIGYSQACYSGAFDNRNDAGSYISSDCVTEHLNSGAHGCAAFVANSRYGWGTYESLDGPSQFYDRQFWDNILGEGILELGHANDKSKEDNVNYISDPWMRWCYYEINLFGDPALRFRTITSRGIVALDRTLYAVPSTATITVTDADLDLNPTGRDTVNVEMAGTTEVTSEIVTLTETGNQTKTFVGAIQLVLGAPVHDGKLQVGNGDTIRVKYHDADDGTGHAADRIATATVDTAAPVISNVAAVDITDHSARIIWRTDEPADSRVDYGETTPTTRTAFDGAYVTSHSVILNSLRASTRYFYRVASTDMTGVNASQWPAPPQYVEFQTSAPVMTVVPTSFTFTLYQGQTSASLMWIRNSGPSAVQWSLREREFTGALGARGGVGFWLSIPDSINPEARPNTADAATPRKPSGYKWLAGAANAGGPNILVYMDDVIHTAPNTFADQALVRLGLSYTAYYDSAYSSFETALTTGGPWDLVICGGENYGPPTSTLDRLDQYVAAGGKLVIYSWMVANNPTHPLWARLGVSFVANYSSASSVYWWQPAHDLFNSPEVVPQFTSLSSIGYGVYGQRVNALTGATALGGLTASPQADQAALILGSAETTLFRGFFDAPNSANLDSDGVLDGIEFWENTIGFLIDPVPWLDETPKQGTTAAGGATSVTVSVDAREMAVGAYRAYILVNSAALGEPATVTVTMQVLSAPMLVYDSYRIEDPAPGGDGDGCMEPGETANIYVRLRNAGGLSATGIAGAFTFTTPGMTTVTLVNGNLKWPDIPSSETAWSLNAIVVATSPTCPSGQKFRLAGLVDEANPQFGPWPVTLPDIEVRNVYSISGHVYDQNTSLPVAGVTVTATPSAPPAVFWDDMESGKAKWTADFPWDHTTAASHSPTTCWTDSPGGDYSDDTYAGLYSVSFSLVGVTNTQLRFWHRYELEEDADYAEVYITVDGGGTWDLLAQFTGINMTWHEEVLDLSAYDGQANVMICFWLSTDWSITYDGWYVDDVAVGGQVQGAGFSAITDSYGAYQINGLTSDTYNVSPDAAGSGYSASSPTLRLAMVPPEVTGADFRLLSPAIGVWPTSFTFTVRQGETSESLLWIGNTGSAALRWMAREEVIGGGGGGGGLSLGRGGATGSFLTVADSIDPKATARALGTASSRKPFGYRWTFGATNAAEPKILVYADDFIHTAPNTYVDQALARLALSYTAYYDQAFAGFEQALASGGPWNLVIFDDENYRPPASTFQALNDYVTSGGKLVISTWVMDSNPGLPIWTQLGVAFRADDNEPPDPVYWWQPTHLVFTYPESVPQFTGRVGGLYEPYGQQVAVLPGASALAGYTVGGPEADQAALVLNAGGRGIFKGFSDCDNNADLDTDGVPDPVELWENLISYHTDVVPWLFEIPSSGTVAIGGTSSTTVRVDATDMAVGAHRANILITANDPRQPVTTVPVTMNVLEGVPDIEVDPDSLDFGVVWIGYSRTEIITLSNDGYSTLTIQSLSLVNSDFTTVSVPALPIRLIHHQTANVSVRFAPHAIGPSTGTLTVRSNDPDSSAVVVPLRGIGATQPAIRLTPDPITTVTLYQDQLTTRLLTIHNDGGSTLTVQMIRDEETTPPRLTPLLSGRGDAPAPPKPGEIRAGADYVPNEVLVKYRKQTAVALAQALDAQLGAQTVRSFPAIGVELMKLGPNVSVAEAVSRYVNSGLVEYAEPNYIRRLNAIPNDPDFGQLWGMHNTGQTGGTPDADIDAPEGWDLATGSDSIVVGGIDTGINYTHPDLAANVWTNPGEIPGNGIDDDGNGYVDDVHGYDFVNRDSDPMDDNGHGSHTAGTIGAVGNNGVGVAGVCWRVRMAALKAFDADGYATDAALLEALLYANRMGFKATNNSWGGSAYSQSFKDAIDAGCAMGALLIASAGNSAVNTDIFPQYPACYDSPNIISVCATDHNDQLVFVPGWWGSNWGPTTVDLGAPGLYIYSTVLGTDYTTYSGTSMAAPHVTGAAALLWSYVPQATSTTIKQAILAAAQPVPGLTGKCLTGARLNLPGALHLAKLYSGAPWVWEEPPRPVPIPVPAGGALDVVVHYDARIPQAVPGPGVFFGRILVASNDPVTSEAAVNTTMEVLVASNLRYAGQVVDDDTSPPSSGDGDGYAEPGETIEVWVDLRNWGLLAANDVAGTFTLVSGTSVTLLNGNIVWPDIPGGETRRSSASLVLSIPTTCPVGTEIVLRGMVDDANPTFGPWQVDLTTITVVRAYSISGTVRDGNTSAPIQGATVRCESSGLIFGDDFEDGNYAGWTVMGGAYTRQVTNTTAANGTVYSFTQTGGSISHLNGVKQTFDHIKPDRMDFWVRSASTSAADGYFVIGDDNLGAGNSGLIWFYCRGTGYFWVNYNETFAYAANTWYHVEFVLDWNARTFDYYVNSSFIAAGIAFRTAETTDLTQLHLYNYDNSQAWWDEIRIGGGATQQRLTAADGTYRFTGLDAGDYKLTAVKAGSVSSPTQQLVTLPPDASGVDFYLLSGDIDVTPTSFTFTAKEGQPTITTASMTISSTGRVPLTWSLEEEDLGFVALSGGPDAFGYRWKDSDDPGGPMYAWREIGATGTNMNLSDDSYFFPINLPFSFKFYGVEYNQIAVGSNGTVYFEDSYLGYGNTAIPGTNSYGVNTFIAVYWDDLDPGSGGGVYYEIQGTAPNRVLVVEWHEVPIYSTGNPISVEALLFERTGKILLQYEEVSSDAGNGATVGIQASPTLGLQYLYNSPALHDSLAVEFTGDVVAWLDETPRAGVLGSGATTTVVVTANSTGLAAGIHRANLIVQANDPDEPVTTVSVTLNVGPGDPDIDTTPTALNFGQVYVGAPQTRAVTVSNVGYGTLAITALNAIGAPVWTVVSPLPGQLPVNLTQGQSRDIVVQFNPSAVGPSTSTLEIISDSPGETTVTIPLSGEGIARPQIQVSAIPLADVPIDGWTTRSVHIQNVGQGPLVVSAITKEYLTEFGALPLLAPQGIVAVVNNETLNNTASSVPIALITYNGDQMSFGVTDYGEIVPFQYPVGAEHIAVGGILEGYVVCYQDTLGDHVASAHFGSRHGLVPVSYTEIEDSTSRTVVRVVTRTTDGKLEITHLCSFDKFGKAIAVRASVNNLSTETLGQVVYKRVCDWDVDNSPTSDTFAFDSRTSMTYAYETHYVGVAGDRAPDYRDLDGWDDYNRRLTDGDYPDGPVMLDGLTVLHYELGWLAPAAEAELDLAFVAGDSLDELRDGVRSVFGWLTVDESALPRTLAPTASMDVLLRYNAKGLPLGDYEAALTVISNDPLSSDVTRIATLRVLDATSPTVPGTPVPDKTPYTSRTIVVYTWSPSFDPETGIEGYQCQVGTWPGGSNIFNGTTTTTMKSVTGANGQTLYCRVRAINGQDMYSAWSGNSAPTLIDTSRPSRPSQMQDGGAFTSQTLVTFTWTASTDGTSGSGVASYDVQIGTRPNASNLFNGNVGNVLTKAITGSNGQNLYGRVRARDRAGNVGFWRNSNGILIDTQAPPAPARPTDAGMYTTSTLVRFDWTAVVDSGTTPSGIASYVLQVGTTPGGSNIFNGNVGNVLTRTVTGAHGQTLYARVCARDRAGNVGPWSPNSDGILIDTVAPPAPARPTDAGTYTTSTLVRFNWTAVTDSGSGLASYDLQVGTTPGGSNIFNGNVGNVLTRTVTGTNGQTLYARVRARDRAGNVGLWSPNSDGILIDTARPTTPGVPRDAGAFTSSTSVRFDWTAATDSGSGVASYDLQVGTTPGGSDIFNGNVGNVLTRTVTGANGQTLYARARARDRAGNVGLWSGNSDGIRLDMARPRLTSVVARDYMTLDVTFNEVVRFHDLAPNYSCTAGLRILGGMELSGTQCRLYTSVQTPGTSYTLTVGYGVKDRASNSMDPAYRSRSFTGGIVTGVQSWELYR